MSKAYEWGTAPKLKFTVSDNISRSSSGSTYYSGTLTVTFDACTGGSTFGYYIDVSVNGTTKRLKENTPNQWTSLSTSFSVSGNSTASSITIQVSIITNAARGNKYVDYTTNIGSYSSGGSSGGGSSTPTAGASVPTLSAKSCKLGESVTIYTNRQNSSYKHTITYAAGGATGTIGSNIDTSVAWTPPLSLIDSVTSGGTQCVITVTTYYGSTSRGSATKSMTLYPPDNAAPTVSDGWVDVERDNTGVGVAAWVRGYSKARIVFDSSKVTGNYSATISGFYIQYGGEKIDAVDGVATTGPLSDANASILCVVKDSRGNYTTESVVVPTLEYAPPTVTGISVYRSDEAMTPEDDGLHISAKATAGCSPLDGANSVTLTARYRAMSAATFGAALTLSSNTLTLITGDTDISTMQSYVVRLTATDALGNATSVDKTVSTKSVTFHLKDGGRGAAFGKYAEEDAFDCQWDARFGQSVNVVGGVTIDGKELTELIRDVVTPMLPTTLDIDAIYPVGSIYMSLEADADPNELFSGTVWEQIVGKFLLASSEVYALGATGGEASVVLTTDQMPGHNHVASVSTDGKHSHTFPGRASNGDNGPSAESYASSNDARTLSTNESGYHSHTVTISSAGGGASHNNMPPYLVVNMWKRVS